jgi:hypothetical protein
MKTCVYKTALLMCGLFVAVLTLAQANPPKPAQLAQDPQQIVKFLTEIVSWHRQLAGEQQIAEASDSTAVQENRRIADQVVQLAFEYARSQALLQAKHPATAVTATPEPQADSDTESQALAQAARQADKEVTDTEAELQSVQGKLANAPPQNKNLRPSQAGEKQGALAMSRARRDASREWSSFVPAAQERRAEPAGANRRTRPLAAGGVDARSRGEPGCRRGRGAGSGQHRSDHPRRTNGHLGPGGGPHQPVRQAALARRRDFLDG